MNLVWLRIIWISALVISIICFRYIFDDCFGLFPQDKKKEDIISVVATIMSILAIIVIAYTVICRCKMRYDTPVDSYIIQDDALIVKDTNGKSFTLDNEFVLTHGKCSYDNFSIVQNDFDTVLEIIIPKAVYDTIVQKAKG